MGVSTPEAEVLAAHGLAQLLMSIVLGLADGQHK